MRDEEDEMNTDYAINQLRSSNGPYRRHVEALIQGMVDGKTIECQGGIMSSISLPAFGWEKSHNPAENRWEWHKDGVVVYQVRPGNSFALAVWRRA